MSIFIFGDGVRDKVEIGGLGWVIGVLPSSIGSS